MKAQMQSGARTPRAVGLVLACIAATFAACSQTPPPAVPHRQPAPAVVRDDCTTGCLRKFWVQSCSEARGRGIAPLRSGDPWYRPELDQDGDGVAC
jgi:hypothetical protein